MGLFHLEPFIRLRLILIYVTFTSCSMSRTCNHCHKHVTVTDSQHCAQQVHNTQIVSKTVFIIISNISSSLSSSNLKAALYFKFAPAEGNPQIQGFDWLVVLDRSTDFGIS